MDPDEIWPMITADFFFACRPNLVTSSAKRLSIHLKNQQASQSQHKYWSQSIPNLRPDRTLFMGHPQPPESEGIFTPEDPVMDVR